MSTDLRHDIRQQRPFTSLHQEAFLNVSRTEGVLSSAFERMLAPHGISLTQYNVLRILRGGGDRGLCRNEIRDRLIARMPDVSRLLDRMEEAGLIERERGTADRRLVYTRLTTRGRSLVDALDLPVAEEHARRLGHMSPEQLLALVELLTMARNAE